ncbi:MAG TPA: hypothetical protein DFS52_01740 [Myxococcales bacterium]|jgi:hypothetical protein|nr:hypothetical protein [Myxococcales bacterium]
MRIGSKKLVVSLVGILALVAYACGEDREDEPGENVRKDGGVYIPDAGSNPTLDAGNTEQDAGNPAPDAGNTTSDAGHQGADAGYPPGTETTVPEMNRQEVEPGKVTFKAIVVSPRMRISKNTDASNPAGHYCLYGTFVADQTAPAENNGVMLTSKSTVTDGICNPDSQLHGPKDNDLAIGEELAIRGFYQEYCYRDGTSCVDRDSTEKEISFPQVNVNMSGDVVRTGNRPGVPVGLPAEVAVDEVSSTGSATPYTLGSKWWQYRAVLVKVTDVDAGGNPDTGGDYCEWTVSPAGQTSPALRVDDGLLFGGEECPHRPAAGTHLSSLTGLLYWTYGNSKLLPRFVTDATPALPE